MAEGPVAVQQQFHSALHAEWQPAGNTYRGVTINDSTAHLGHSYVSHNYYYSDDAQSRILDDLSRLRYGEVHDRFQYQRLAGTGAWFLESQAYREWRDEDSSAPSCASRTNSLWCPGPPGVGKTFLASNIIDDLKACAGVQSYAVAFCYANRDRDFEQSVPAYLSCLARLLVESIPEPQREASLGVVEAHSRTYKIRTTSTLLELLAALVWRFERVYIVVDALDEFSTNADDRIGLVKALLSFQAKSSPGNVRLCITSRDSGECEATLRPRWSVNIVSSWIDLRAFIVSCIAESSRLTWLLRHKDKRSAYGPQQDVVDTVLQKSGGIFKIASLQMTTLAKQLSLSAVRSSMEELSAQIDIYYQKAWDRVEANPDFGPVIKRLLGWLLFLRRPLSQEELAQAMGITATTPTRSSPADLEVHLDSIISMAEGLIASYPSTNLPITFSHGTVRTFLQSNLALLGGVDWNADIARTYLRYMSLRDCLQALDFGCEELFAQNQLSNSPMAWYSLVNEAASSWVTYDIAAKESLSSMVQDFAGVVARQDSAMMLCCFYNWPAIAQVLVTSFAGDPHRPYMEMFSPIHVAVDCGSIEVVRSMISRMSVGVNSKGFALRASDYSRSQVGSSSTSLRTSGDTGLAWTWGSSNKLKRILKWGTLCVLELALSEAEGKAPLPYNPVGRRLPGVSSEAIPSPLRLPPSPILNDDYVIQRFGNTLLHVALDRRVDRQHAAALASPPPQHRDDMLQLLLEHPYVDVNAAGFAGMTPLFVAIQAADVDAVRKLTQYRGLDVNVVTEVGHALSWALQRMCYQQYAVSPNRTIETQLRHAEASTPGFFDRMREILDLLLHCPGVDVDRQDRMGHTALDWLVFYQTLLTNKEVLAFIDSGREWLGNTGCDTAVMVRSFYEKCRFPFEAILGPLRAHGVTFNKPVELDDWLTWFCPPAVVVCDEGSGDASVERYEQRYVETVYFLRVPFADLAGDLTMGQSAGGSEGIT